MTSNKVVLNDVMVMRPIVIILLVFMHSFTMYSGGTWTLPEGIHEVPAYGRLTRISFSFMLEAFVFISGYLLCFQFQRKDYQFLPFVGKKAKRLIIPSIIFSTAYFLLFKHCENPWQSIYAIPMVVDTCGICP